MANIFQIIDGSVLEGGGQILRNAVALSSLLHKAISIQKIRSGRTPPGLKNQHRTGIELAAKIASADLDGAVNGSTVINFVPKGIKLPNDYSADVKTAGSVTLLLQIALPLLLFSPSPVPASTLTLLGGTNASMAPQVDYTKYVFLPFLSRLFGVDVKLDVQRRGYFPKGGGKVVASVTPLVGEQTLPSFKLLERGKVKSISGISHFAKLPNVIGDDMVKGALRRLEEAGYRTAKGAAEDGAKPSQGSDSSTDIPISISHCREPDALTTGAGSGIVLWAELEGGGILGGSAVGSKGKSAEKIGEDAATELIDALEAGGCVDEHAQDQLIIFMALAEGTSEVRCGKGGLTLHTRTAIWLAQKLTDAQFEVTEESSGTTLIRCRGIGVNGSKLQNAINEGVESLPTNGGSSNQGEI